MRRKARPRSARSLRSRTAISTASPGRPTTAAWYLRSEIAPSVIIIHRYWRLMMHRILRNLILIASALTAFVGLAQETNKSLLLVLIKPQNKMVIVDPVAKKVVGEVPTGTGPHEVTVSADGKLAIVSNYGDRTPGQSLSVIDLSSRKELRRVDLGALRRPHGIVQAAGKVYFTAEVNKVVVRYDPAGDRLDWLMGTGQDTSHMIVINHDQSKIFTANIQSDSVTVLEPRGQTGAWHATAIP